MPAFAAKVTCGDGFTDAATIENVWDSAGGSFALANTGGDAIVQLQSGPVNQGQWGSEAYVPAGSSAPIYAGTTGIRFRNAVAGSPAIVISCSIAGKREPALTIAAGPGGQTAVTGFAVFNVRDNGGALDGVTDDSAAWAKTVAKAAAGGGGIVYWDGPSLLGPAAGSIQIPPDTPIHFLGGGRGRAVIKLSAAAPSAFVFAKRVDGDVFRNLTFTDFDVDASGVNEVAHVLLGTYSLAAGFSPVHVNYQDIEVGRIRVLNVATDPAHAASNMNAIYWYLVQNTPGELTQNYMRRIYIHDLEIEGGNSAVVLAGTLTGAGSTMNALIDEIVVERVSYDSLLVPAAINPNDAFQFGSFATGGRLTLRDLSAAGASDSSYEINAFAKVDADNLVSRDAANYAFLHKQFVASAEPGGEQLNFTNCRAEWLNMEPGSDALPGYAFALDNDTGDATGQPIGHVKVRDFSIAIASQTRLRTYGQAVRVNRVPVRSLTIDGLRWSSLNFAGAGVAGVTDSPVMLAINMRGPAASTIEQTFTLKNVLIRLFGTRDANGAQQFTGMNLDGNDGGSGPLSIEVDGFDIDFDVTSIASSGFTYAVVGGLAGSSLAGIFRSCRILRLVGAAGANKGIIFGDTSTLTIPSKIIVDDDSDLTAASAGYRGISQGAGNEGQLWFDSGPVALAYAANWADFGAPFAAATVRKTPDGYCQLAGVPKAAVGAAAGIATLPAGFRPEAQADIVLGFYNGSAWTVCAYTVSATGALGTSAVVTAAGNAYPLDGARYRIAA